MQRFEAMPAFKLRLRALASLALGLACLGPTTDGIDHPDRNWRNGPVRLSMNVAKAYVASASFSSTAPAC